MYIRIWTESLSVCIKKERQTCACVFPLTGRQVIAVCENNWALEFVHRLGLTFLSTQLYIQREVKYTQTYTLCILLPYLSIFMSLSPSHSQDIQTALSPPPLPPPQ